MTPRATTVAALTIVAGIVCGVVAINAAAVTLLDSAR